MDQSFSSPASPPCWPSEPQKSPPNSPPPPIPQVNPPRHPLRRPRESGRVCLLHVGPFSAELEHETQLLADPGNHPAHRRRGLVALSAQPPFPQHHDHAAGEIILQCEVTA